MWGPSDGAMRALQAAGDHLACERPGNGSWREPGARRGRRLSVTADRMVMLLNRPDPASSRGLNARTGGRAHPEPDPHHARGVRGSDSAANGVTARAIREGKNLEALVGAILEAKAE